MKYTASFTALVLAAYLYDEGYRWLPFGLAAVTVGDFIRATPRRELTSVALFMIAGIALPLPIFIAIDLAVTAIGGAQASIDGEEWYWTLIPLGVLCGLGTSTAFDRVMEIRDQVRCQKAKEQGTLLLTDEVKDGAHHRSRQFGRHWRTPPA